MRRAGGPLRLSDTPFLKAGIVAMVFALTLVGVVAVVAYLSDPVQPAAAVKSTENQAVEPLVRSDPGVDPWVEKDVRAPMPEPEPEPKPEPKPEPEPQPEPQPKPEPEARPDPEPDPEPASGSGGSDLPVGNADWPLPSGEQIETTNRPRQYELAPGAIMGLTVDALGLYDVPVLNSDGQWALDNGVVHVPETSMPWSQTPERNVYLAGHRLGWPGTGSHLVFYRLNELGNGDEVTLRGRDGTKYKYRVIDTFVVNPDETWVMGRVRGRDLLTLQTCTPIPSFDKRLIIRAERV